jgi:hypothetical protein
MIPKEKVAFFAEQVREALKAGHETVTVEAFRDETGEILVTGDDASGSTLAAITLSSMTDMEEAERTFSIIAAWEISLSRTFWTIRKSSCHGNCESRCGDHCAAMKS